MKKIFIVSLFLVLFLVGCTNADETNYEELMYAQAKQYYEDHGKKIYEDPRGDKINLAVNNYIVELEKLKNANNYGNDYDLTGLEKCADETLIDLAIDKTTLEIQSYEFVNKCK